MAALRHATRRLACQRPPAIHRAAVAEQPRRLLNGGLSAVGRNFSLAGEQQWILPRLVHGGSPSVGRTYSRQFSSFNHEPNPSTFMERAKEAFELWDRTMELMYRTSIVLFKLALAGVVVLDCCRSQYLLMIVRVMLGLEPQEWFLTDDKEDECPTCGHALGEGRNVCHHQQQQSAEEDDAGR
ncbi:uncharacterized protein LOC124647548 [Lolium rigidum]|uniref:uncharacterized protein LOC124647548 n=1 Tax=Lolium rigidum TaxID=89674 RepID=UPI001F5CDFBF|nr:uncharacterized protein LOC124647548 [Lolium rigidum]